MDMKKVKAKLSNVGLFNSLNQQVKWDWRLGFNKKNYVIEYTSDFISSSIIGRIFDYLLKGAKDKPKFSSLPMEEWVELPEETWENYNKQIVTIFPRTHFKGEYVFLSKRLASLSVFKSIKGFRIKGEVKGLIK